MSDEQAVLDANQAFYTAFAGGDMAAMERIWAREAPVCCIHPAGRRWSGGRRSSRAGPPFSPNPARSR
ncbi:MAG TPA: nuclear transport factor 2 family protein [Alphaproteobacteria bacterium]|nr:nuclear transport factor 2 family protein [Alphaproteobacteria bacterium]HJN60958.1 nuclear transport factor 2 family protein [Alphaproteobacteria bacterium]